MIDSMSARADAPADPFTQHRRLLFATAYRMLGSVADAEDLLQDAWLTWSAADRSRVGNPRAYLVRTVTNLSINRLTSARATRESYVGPWLPEPWLTTPDIAEEAELAESVSMAMLVVLETLGPVERAVFLLREVFGHSHAEIGEMLDRPETTIRRIAHRARSGLHTRRTGRPTHLLLRREKAGGRHHHCGADPGEGACSGIGRERFAVAYRAPIRRPHPRQAHHRSRDAGRHA
jgi:RNA polymerase sigma-70 factor (ECF subfamily)